MYTHGLLSLPFSKDRESSTYDLESPDDHIHCAAQVRAKKLETELAAFDISSYGQLTGALSAIDKCSVLLIDAHGSIDLGLRASALDVVVVGACWQQPARWEHAAPPGCLVIGYKEKLLAGASHGLITHTADLGDLQNIPEGDEGAKIVADWVQAKSHHASKRADKWFVARAKP